MKRTTLRFTVVGAAIALCAVALRPALAEDRADTVRAEIRHALLQLPYYSVFDFIEFKYDRGTAELKGYAYAPTLKEDAENAVKRVAGVDEVKNQIEQLPTSQLDNQMRWKVYYAIYTDPFLQKYAPGGGFLWGHRHAFAGGFAGLYGGWEPAGDYPIHIIVKNQRITLIGVVDNEGDKTLAGMRARQVPGSFAMTNDLVVEKSSTSN